MRSLIAISLTLLLTLFVRWSFAQEENAGTEKDLRQQERQGERHLDKKEWEEAKAVFQELIKEAPNDDYYNFNLGIAYLQSGIEVEKAEMYLAKVSANNIVEKNYFYGQALHYNGKFDEAIRAFNDFMPLTASNKAGVALQAELDLWVKQCESGKKLQGSANSNLRVDNLGEEVNTTGREYAPAVYSDRDVLVFTGTTTEEGQLESIKGQQAANEDILVTKYMQTDDVWSKPATPKGEVLKSSVNSSFNESSILFTDNKKFYFYRYNDLYSVEPGQEPVAQNVMIGDLNADDIIAIYVSKDEKYRFMVTDMFAGGQGGRDIYFSQNQGGTWSVWQNLAGVNTPADEDSPYLDADGTLYFSSNGPNSMGGHDIFKATRSGNSWANPVNVGAPINTPADDIHFVPVDGTKQGYMASSRTGSKGSFDIYRVWECKDLQETTIGGRLLAEGKPVKAEIFLKDSQGNRVGSTQVDEKTGKYSLKVKPEESYTMEVAAANYKNHTFSFNVPEQCEAYDLYQDLAIDLKKDADGNVMAQTAALTNAFYDIDRYREEKTPEEFFASLPDDHRLKPNTTEDEMELELDERPIQMVAAEFKDVRFGYDSDVLEGTAEAIIDKMADYLKENKDAKVILSGHTDSKGAAWYNKALSKRRANSVARALRKRGVDKSRVQVMHYGEEKLLEADYDKDGNYLAEIAQKNRRVEIEVVLPEAEQK